MVTPNTLRHEHLTAIVDTREQRPLNLRPMNGSWGTLQSGDYSVAGLESVVAVERKSLPDLLACVGRERDRFERELHRLRGYEFRLVVVECSWADLLAGGWRSQLTPRQVTGSILGWSRWIQFLFPGNRDQVAEVVRDFLLMAARQKFREVYPLLLGAQMSGKLPSNRGLVSPVFWPGD